MSAKLSKALHEPFRQSPAASRISDRQRRHLDSECRPEQLSSAAIPAIPAGLHPDVLDAMAAAGATVQVIVAACRAAWRLATGAAAPKENLSVQTSSNAQASCESVRMSRDIPAESSDVAEMSRDSGVKLAPKRRRRSDKQRADHKRAADRNRSRVKRKQAQHERAIAAGQRDLFTAPVIDELSRDSTCEMSRDSAHQMSRDAACDPPSPSSFSPTPPHITTPSPNVTAQDDARPPTKSLISKEAFDLTEQIGKAAGFPDLQSQPLGWAGAAYEIQNFLNDGCPAEIVRIACIEVIGSRGPPDTFIYFRKPVQRARARHEAPLPAFKPGESSHVEPRKSATGWQARRDAGHAALAKLRARVEAFDLAEGGGGSGGG